MVERRHIRDIPDPTPPEEDEALSVVASPQPPTLEEAFTVLAQALHEHFSVREHVPMALHIGEVQAWYTDGNHTIAWQHLMQALEVALGATLHTR